ncbi:MAG: type II secretion system protein GspM [Gammaproteobacteria bacterium]
MIETLSDGQRRAAAVAILILLVGLVMSVTVLPLWLANRHYQDNIDALQGRWQQLRQVAAAGASLQPRYEQLKSWQVSDVRYLTSDNESLAAAELQQVVKRIVTANQAEILSTQIVPPVQEQGFTRVALRVRMRGTLESAVAVFYSIETDKLFLFLDSVSVRALGSRYQQRKVNTRQSLDMDFELVGYMPHQS